MRLHYRCDKLLEVVLQPSVCLSFSLISVFASFIHPFPSPLFYPFSSLYCGEKAFLPAQDILYSSWIVLRISWQFHSAALICSLLITQADLRGFSPRKPSLPSLVPSPEGSHCICLPRFSIAFPQCNDFTNIPSHLLPCIQPITPKHWTWGKHRTSLACFYLSRIIALIACYSLFWKLVPHIPRQLFILGWKINSVSVIPFLL